MKKKSIQLLKSPEILTCHIAPISHMSRVICQNFNLDEMFAPVASWIGGIANDSTRSYSYGNPTKEYLPLTFSFACWNIYKGRKSNFTSEFDRYIRSPQCDLYALQEAWVIPENESLYGCGQLTSQFTKKGTPSGTFNGSSVITRGVENYRTINLEPLVATPKSATATKYFIGNGSGGDQKVLTLVNFHWLNWTSDEVWFEELEKVIRTIPESGPLIIAGDFNTRKQWRIDQLVSLLAERKKLQLDLEAHYSKKKILDFIFTRDLKMLEHQIIETDGSDHPLLMVKYSLLDSP